MDAFTIELDSASGVYFPGQILNGHVVIKLREPVKARSVSIAFIGKAKTAWTMWEQYSANRSTKSEAVPYYAEVVYADLSSTVWTPPPNTHSLAVGENRFPFSFLIPAQAPPTFEGTVGFIRYILKAKIDRPWIFDHKTQIGFTVTPHFDLTTLSYAAFPVQRVVSKQLGALWFKHGQIEAKLSLSKSGFVPGESILLNVDVTNNSNRDLTRIEASLVQSAYYTAHRHATRLHYGYSQNKEIEHKTENRVVIQYVEEFKTAKHSTNSYRRMLAVPPVAPSFNACELIQVSYFFKVKIIAKGKLSNTVVGDLPMLVGTVPVRTATNIESRGDLPVRDFLTPPQPTIPAEDARGGLNYADCLFGKGTMAEDPDERTPDYTPKYIFYSNVP